MEIETRAAAHAALGDVHRIAMVDHLATGDLSVAELRERSGLPGNLLAHHLDVLEDAGLISRRTSEGDRRRKYVTLRREGLPSWPAPQPARHDDIVFVCTHNSARSQFAAALWELTTGETAQSAGTTPASRVNPTAVRVADEFGVDISTATPGGYDRLTRPGLVITVCDRAREGALPPSRELLHWSVPDPVASGRVQAFRSAFADIAERIDVMARAR